MNAVKSIRKSIANAMVVVILVLASLAAVLTISVNTGNMSVAPVIEPEPLGDVEESAIVEDVGALGGSRGLNGDGNDYADLYRDGNDDPQILIDGAAPGVNDIYIGEPNVQLDIPIRSIKEENGSDRWGDDILYNVTMDIDSTATQYWSSTGCCWIDASEYLSWDTSTISPDYKEDWANSGNALLIDGVGSKYVPWFYNDYGDPEFLDRDNDQIADNNEFYQIGDDYKMYEGYIFDVAGDAPAGVYNISVNITYKYQTFQNVAEQPLSGGFGNWYDPDNAGPSGTGDLGEFEYYFWEPYEKNGGTVNFAVPDNIRFRKRFDYFENNCLPTSAYWEAIPDLGYIQDDPNDYSAQAGAWDCWSNYDRDGVSLWYDGNNGELNATVNPNWNTWDFNDYANWPGTSSYTVRTCDQYPYDPNDGNGTWQYSGYEGDTVWTSFKTETEYIEIRVEHGTRFSQPAGDGCELVPDVSDPYYLKAGDDFKKMYIRINNQDVAHHMTDVFVNLTLDNPEYFTLKHDWAWKDQINSGGIENYFYRIDAKNGTPVNRYTGTAVLTYTREHVRVTEDLPVEFILYFTPNLRNHGGLPVTELEVSQVIHTGLPETTVDFSVTNSGNTLLENGILTMDYSNFKNKGDEYTDPEGGEGTYSQRIEVPSIDHSVGSNTHDVSVNVEIPDHWSLTPGVYKLLMDYEGYYFNDGVIGEPTNYVKIWMDWYDDDFDSSTDMNAYCVIDTDGDENMDIFGADETKSIEGIYTYVEVEEFDPYSPLLEIYDVSINGGTDTFEQGTITNGEIELSLTNNGESNITDLSVELDLEGYFTGEQYYDGYTPNVVNPTDSLFVLNIGETGEVTLDVEGINQLLPPGVHRLTLKYMYSYDNGSTPSEISTDIGELYFTITVTDSTPDIVPTVSGNTGILRVADKLVDIKLYVNLANKEYYKLSHITGTLTVGDNTPFIPAATSTGTGPQTVDCKWTNPAADSINANAQNLNNMYFDLNLHPEVTEGTYYLNMTLSMVNEQTMETLTVPTTLEVKIYPKIAKLRITNVAVSAGKIAPGQEFILDITIQNDGGEAAREVYIEFQEAYVSGEAVIESYENINPTGAKYPFSSDVMKAYIAEILPQSTGQATFTVRGDLNIYPGVTYFQNIEFVYKDSTGTDHTTMDVAPIKSVSSTKVSVGGEKYVWDTDREAWISETELKSEEVMDYMPYMITGAIAIWLVTLLIIFMFIIRPRYKKEKMKMYNESDDVSESTSPPDHEKTIEDTIKTHHDKPPESVDEMHHEDRPVNVIDYSTPSNSYSTPEPLPPLPPALPPAPPQTSESIPPIASPTPEPVIDSTPASSEPEEPPIATSVPETNEDPKEEETKESNDSDKEPLKAAPVAEPGKKGRKK